MGQRISQLDLAGPLSGTEYFAIVQDGKTKKAQASSFTPLFTGGCQCTLVSRGESVSAPDTVFEEYLQTYQMPPNTLSNIGDWVEIISFGSFAVNTNVKNVFTKVHTNMDELSSTGSVDETAWEMRSIVMKSSASQIKMSSYFTMNGAAHESENIYTVIGANTQDVIQISVGSYGLNAAADVIVEGFIVRLNQVDTNS